MVDISNALNNLNSLQSSLQAYVVAPLNAFGLGGFVFDIEGEARVELTNDITDHFVENNSAVQDHISVKPKRITLRNYVGEVVYQQDSSTNTPLQNAVQKLTILSAALPALSAGAQQAANLFNQQSAGASSLGQAIAADANTGANLYGLVKNLLSAQSNKQQQAYQYFKALRDQKTIFSVQTPFEFMTSMAIETIVAIQPEDSIYISNFAITLKEIRTASTTTLNTQGSGPKPTGYVYSSLQAAQTDPLANGGFTNPADLQGRLSEQAAPTTQQGIMPGIPVPAPANIYPNNVSTVPDITSVLKSSNFKYLGLQ